MQKSLDNKQSQASLFTNNQNLSQNTVKLSSFSHSYTFLVKLLCTAESTNMKKFVHKSEVE